MKRKGKRVNLLLSAVVAGSLVQLPVPVMAETETPDLPKADIFPVPQDLAFSSEQGMELSGPVDVIVHGERNHAAVDKLGALLDAQGLEWAEVTEATEGHSQIVLAVECEEDCTTCSMVPDAAGALDHPQGYVLKTSDDEIEQGQIVIVGTDKDGVYYGVMTLRQLFLQKAGDSIAEVVVSDYPDVLYRGYVEGFYGTPWTFEDRTSLFEDTSLYKMNTYVYAPKDDPYHRASWRTLYPEDKAAEIRSLVKTADDNNMIFCWTIHPGADYDYTTDADGDGVVDDFQKLLDKVDQVYALGVRQFGIFYDDLDTSAVSGTAHAQTLNAVYDHLMNTYGDVKPMVTVLTRYTNSWGASVDGYLKPFMDTIHKDTLVLWTGNSTMSAITKDYFEWPKTQTGVLGDFGVWWNYPVTDYYAGHLLMGPLECVDNDVDNIASFYMNPMSEADASKVTIFSGADYSWNIGAFDAIPSWRRAIQELVPEATDEFCRFADNLAYNDKGNGFVFEESQYLKEDIEALKAAIATGENFEAAVSKMKENFAQIKNDCVKLRALNNTNLQDEINSYVDQYEKLGTAGMAAMDALLLAKTGTVDEVIAKRTELKTAATQIANASSKVGNHVLVPLLNDVADSLTELLSGILVSKQSCDVLKDGTWTKAEQNDAVYSTVPGTLKKDETVTFRISNAVNFSVAAENAAGLKAEVSLNGLDWTEIDLLEDAVFTGCWTRFTALEDGVNPGVLSVKEARTAKRASVSTTMPVYQDYIAGKAFDGSLDTNFWSSRGSRAGDTLTTYLGGLYEISSVEVAAGINRLNTIDCFAKAILEVSMDGQTWTAIGNEFAEADFARVEGDTVHAFHTETFEPVQTRYIRMRALQASDSWLKLYEIAPEKTLIAYESAVITSSMSAAEGRDLIAGLDGNTATYMESAAPAAAGEWIQVDLGNFVPLYDASISFAANDGKTAAQAFASTKLQVSKDGRTWKDLSTVAAADLLDESSSKGCYTASWSINNEQARYLRFTADQASESTVRVAEIYWNTKVDAASAGSISASTNMNVYQTNVIGNAVDGDTSTRFYSNAVSKTGDYIQLSLGDTVPLYDASIIYGGDPHKDACDGFASTKLQVSADGKTWTDVTEAIPASQYKVVDGRYICSFTLDGIEAHYIRFTAGADSTSWCQVYEAEINKTLDINPVRYTSGSASVFNANLLNDGDLLKGPSFYQIQAGQTLVYPMTSITDVESIGILQSTASISGTTVEAELLDGSYVSLGTLASEWNSFAVNNTIRSIRLTFDGSVQPEIFEIIVNGKKEEAPVKEADKTLLNLAIAYAEQAAEDGALENLNETVLAYFNEALEEAKAISASSTANQAAVDAAWAKLAKAVHMLGFKADKSVLALIVDQAENTDTAGLSAEEKAALEEALKHAKEVLEDPNALQERIDEAAAALQEVLASLHPETLDTSLLELLISSIGTIDADKYLNNHGEVDEMLAALEEGNAILAAPESQSAIDASVNRIHTAWLALRLRPDESLLARMDAFLDAAAKADLSALSKEEKALVEETVKTVSKARSNPDLSQDDAIKVVGEIDKAEAILAKAGQSVSKPAGNASSVKTSAATSAAGFGAALGAAAVGLLAILKRRNRK